VFAQQSNTMYFMQKTPQTTLLNPAFKADCKFYIGGALVNATPILGQVFLPLAIDFTNTGFDYSTIIHKGTASYQDSLIIDTKQFVEGLKDYNYLMMNFNVDILSFGFRVKDYSITFNATEKVDFKFGYSDDLFKIPYYGNADDDMIGKDLKMAFGVDAIHYREFAVGVSKPINDKLTVGGKAKVLFGMANVQTKNNEIVWNTDADNFDYTFKAETEINTSVPFLEFFYNDTTGIIDSVKSVQDYNVQNYFMNFKNTGFGLDLGATYKINDKITVAASVIDLGFITWKDNPYSVKNTGDFNFTGLDVFSEIFGKDIKDTTAQGKTFLDELVDSITGSFEVKSSTAKYKTFLNPKVYIGGTYQITEKMNAGALARVEFLRKQIRPSLTLSFNTQFKKWFGLTASYSIMNSTFTNAGLGMSIKLGPWKMFIINDNVLGMILPHKARNINWRTGLYLAFGCKEKETGGKAKF
jgi:hypothetical protein